MSNIPAMAKDQICALVTGMSQGSADHLQHLNFSHLMAISFSRCGDGHKSEGEGKKLRPSPPVLLEAHQEAAAAAAVVNVTHVSV